ncbi:uncharacterized protein F5147DRAFT_776037 [Suillus discolor]|uniref:Uncharacterized protein n=1 Tax=Suillus discolor TaxID=1912936 RepID=A0A9P7JS19_9AGAM|nr:uncharacterized protein F5147DRAFT_776037 [Suillus discolor]KAG2103049.1 hypothetical protein F5147DRAFT_776037 [Suillus discolor]
MSAHLNEDRGGMPLVSLSGMHKAGGKSYKFSLKWSILSDLYVQTRRRRLHVNVTKTGSLIFLSRKCMLRTVRAFRSLPTNFLESELLVPLISQLMETEVSALRPRSQSPAAILDQDVDALIFVESRNIMVT